MARFPALLLVATLGCTRPNPSYCDPATPCDGTGQICVLAGDAGAGSCVALDAAPPDAAWCNGPGDCSAPTPYCPEHRCVECETTAQCGADPARPVCDEDYACRACDPGAASAECAAHPATPVCAPGGRCVECVDDEDCGDPARPICEAATSTCRPCAAHAECPAGVCHPDGHCPAESEILFVDAAAAGNPACLRGNPCKTLGVAVGLLNASRGTILVAAGSYPEAVTLDGADALIVAPGADVYPTGSSGAAGLTVRAGATVTVEGLRLHGAALAPGVDCNGATLTLLDVVVEDNPNAEGLAGSHCVLTARRSTFRNNGGIGLVLDNDSQGTLDRLLVSRNDGGGIDIEQSLFSLSNSFVVQNGAAGAVFGGVLLQGCAAGSTLVGVTIAENLAPNNAYDGLRCQMLATTPVLVSSTLVAGNADAEQISLDAAPACSFSYTLVGSGAVPVGTGNLSGDPAFAGPGDFHIQGTSAARNAADPALALTQDYDGQPRGAEGRSDIGADELQP